MKKVLIFLTGIVFVLFTVFFCFNSNVFALTLDNVTTEISKEKVKPGEEVTLTINFGKPLGAYTVNVGYDEAIFDYASSEGGTANSEGGVVKLVFYDSEGGRNPRENAKITFKAKNTITASNPTDFSITLEGLSNNNASETYDDIVVPIKEDILVEPDYLKYDLSLNYTGDILPETEKEMKLVTSSKVGKNYDHVRLIADITKKPNDDATAKLLAQNDDDVEIDLLQSGWGDAEGYQIGGTNVKQELKLTGIFSDLGEYVLHVKLIDRDNSDSVITEKNFKINVGETNDTVTSDENSEDDEEENVTEDEVTNVETLPKTGYMKYVYTISSIVILIAAYVFISTRKERKE